MTKSIDTLGMQNYSTMLCRKMSETFSFLDRTWAETRHFFPFDAPTMAGRSGSPLAEAGSALERRAEDVPNDPALETQTFNFIKFSRTSARKHGQAQQRRLGCNPNGLTSSLRWKELQASKQFSWCAGPRLMKKRGEKNQTHGQRLRIHEQAPGEHHCENQERPSSFHHSVHVGQGNQERVFASRQAGPPPGTTQHHCRQTANSPIPSWTRCPDEMRYEDPGQHFRRQFQIQPGLGDPNPMAWWMTTHREHQRQGHDKNSIVCARSRVANVRNQILGRPVGMETPRVLAKAAAPRSTSSSRSMLCHDRRNEQQPGCAIYTP